jgi:hypothetical protein
MMSAHSIRLHPDIERVALLGWKLMPVWPNRAGCFEGDLKAATHDLDQLERWQVQYDGCNWAVLCGASGLWALDLDVPGGNHKHDEVAAFRGLIDPHGALPAHPHGRSGGGGHLIVFRDAGHPVRNKDGVPAPGMDCKSGKGQFTISPSRHKRTRQPYAWAVAPWEVEAPVAPSWLLKAVQPPREKVWTDKPAVLTESRARVTMAQVIDTVMTAEPGQRNHALNRAAFTAGGLIGSGHISEQDAVNALYAAGRYVGQSDAKCRSTIRSGLASGVAKPLRSDRNG